MPGVKDDAVKTRYELLPPEFLDGTAQVLTLGAQKYSDHNWARGLAYSRLFGATNRHLWAWWAGEDLDAETRLSHLWHASCEIAFLIALEARGRVELDDRPAAVARPAPVASTSGADHGSAENAQQGQREGRQAQVLTATDPCYPPVVGV